MSYTISKDFHFSASHQLHGLSEDHPCGRVHGHNYIVRVELWSPTLDKHGFVWDYGNLKFFAAWLDEQWDHRHLNDVVSFQPTAENMAMYLAEMIEPHIPTIVDVAVSVSETPKTWAKAWGPRV